MFNEKPPVIETKEKEPFDFEKWLSLELPRQYEEKAKILNKLGLLEILPDKKEIGLVGINGKEYPIPMQEDIEKAMRENKEMFERKMKQGFTELEIIPFGLPLEILIKTASRTILKHRQEGKLFYTRKNPEDESEPLVPIKKEELDENQPLWRWDGYDNADTEGNLVYFPKEFSQNHQGKTKEQILKETNQGFQIILRERNINIPREGKWETIGGRPQIDTKGTSIKKYIAQGNSTPSPEEYLKAIQSEEIYKNEEGQTPEDWLVIFLQHLKKHNQVIDDYQGNGSIAYNIGAYFIAGGGVPGSVWRRGNRQAYLGRSDPRNRSDRYGVRGRVRVL